MSVLADKIEQFILHKLLEEDNSDIVLRRNELADELQCAPSQISYVLSTRFSKKQDRTPVLLHERLPAVSISMEDLDALLYQLLKRRSLTNNEAVILHLTFESLYRRIDDEGTRLLVISDILKNLNLH